MAEMVGGALVAEALKSLIKEAKRFKDFEPLSKELAATMEKLLPIVVQIESVQAVGELDDLKKTMDKGRVLVQKCSEVRWFSLNKSRLTRKIERINKDMLTFCQIQLQLLQYKNQTQSTETMEEIKYNVLNLIKILGRFNVFRHFCSVPKLDVVPVGLDQPLRELKNKLFDDSVGRLVVSASGGCGKTTLVTHLCHDEETKGNFEHIFFNVVSSAPNFRVLVQNLLKHNDYDPVTFDNDAEAKVGLEELMEKLGADGPILLVLDDVWPGADSLLEKFLTIPDLKILVTSRSTFPSFSNSTFQLKPLGDKDAEALLLKWAFGPEHTTTPPEYKDLLPKILKRCNGYPIVIKVVGGSLKGQPLRSWKGQVESWLRRETVLGNRDVLDRLQPSFDALKPHLKACFKDLGSFREDQKIRASVIVDIWVELYGTGGSMYMKDLTDLSSQNLLELIPLGGNDPEDGFYNEFLVTQHDILRELAIHQSKLKEENMERNQKRLSLEIRQDNYPNWYLNLTEPIKARLLSISTDDSFSSTWVEMDCPNVEALVLNLSSSNYALPNCIATMKKLKVMIIINHGPNPAKLTDMPVPSSFPNLKRIRLENVSITFLEILQFQLQSLKKLSLFICSFGKVSHDTEGIDVAKALKTLQEIDIDYCSDLVELPNWVSEVVSLETLSITNCNKLTKLPAALGNLTKVEVLRLSSCISLTELPETTDKLSNLRLLDISDCLGLTKLPLEIGNLQKLKKISMRKCSRCELLPDSVTKLENLEVRCDDECAFLWGTWKPKMNNLTVKVEEQEHNLNLFKLF